MKNINNIENIKKPTEEIKFIDLPTVAEIQQNGISPELRKKLEDPNANFKNDLYVFPLNEKDRKIARGMGVAGAIGTGLLTLVCPPAGAAGAATYSAVALASETAKEFSSDEGTKDGAEACSIIYNTASFGGGAGVLKGKVNHSSCSHK